MRQFVALFTFIIVIHGIGSEILQITDKDGQWYCQSASADCTMIVDGDDVRCVVDRVHVVAKVVVVVVEIIWRVVAWSVVGRSGCGRKGI